jgi:predicted LPLAT superfamily acyltransferase
MTARDSNGQAWTIRGERGHIVAIKLIVWIALHLGRPATRLLLYPICLYFMAFTTASGAASRAYLLRVLGHAPRFADRFRHYHCFASCVLDRVYLLNNQIEVFDLRVTDEEIATSEIARGRGCFLFGAHLGSFEVLRALGHRQSGLKLSLVMYEENARKINSVLDAINPDLVLEVIAVGQAESMITVEERLDQSHLIGILADRGLSPYGEEHLSIDFLGKKARFPLGPFRLAAILRRSVILMVGLYRGSNRYDVYFERLADFTELTRDARPEEVENAVRLYVARLEHFCRLAPYNWFNFYDFWQ